MSLPDLPATFGREANGHPLSQQVALMITAYPPRGESAEWHWLQLRAAEAPHINLVAASLERDELLALYGCCDVFLSLPLLRRLCRGMAEALQLGVVDVIATAYGGNTSFCTGPLAHPVRCQEVPHPRGAESLRRRLPVERTGSGACRRADAAGGGRSVAVFVGGRWGALSGAAGGSCGGSGGSWRG